MRILSSAGTLYPAFWQQRTGITSFGCVLFAYRLCCTAPGETPNWMGSIHSCRTAHTSLFASAASLSASTLERFAYALAAVSRRDVAPTLSPIGAISHHNLRYALFPLDMWFAALF